MKVKINKAIYTIKEIKDVAAYLGENSNVNERVYGACSFEDRAIYITRDLQDGFKKDTLMHELAHAFMFEFGHDNRTYNLEMVCNMFGAFADIIVQTANKYMNRDMNKKKRGKNKKRSNAKKKEVL
jgi:Zn-dependent peptidase ImmA (M78 family)